MEFLIKYLDKYCSVIGRILLNTVQELTFLETPVKAIKCCIQDCFPRQSHQTSMIGIYALLFAEFFLLQLIRAKYTSFHKEEKTWPIIKIPRISFQNLSSRNELCNTKI